MLREHEKQFERTPSDCSDRTNAKSETNSKRNSKFRFQTLNLDCAEQERLSAWKPIAADQLRFTPQQLEL